jgi:carbon-monoxide dehydrogenase medium subunit/xanthine dehydrogenase FAD-binding subunit
LDDAGRVAEVRIVPWSATPQIRRFPKAEAVLLGQIPTLELLREAARVAVAEMTEITGKRWSSEFKEPALESMVLRALAQLFDAQGAA